MSDVSKQQDWTNPAAMAIPKGGFSEAEQGRYGPIFPKSSVLLRLLDSREDHPG